MGKTNSSRWETNASGSACPPSHPARLQITENQGGEQEYVGRTKKAPLLPGNVQLPSQPLLGLS